MLTIPWIVEYLGFIDAVSVHIPYYRDVFNLLFKVYYESQTLCHAKLLIRLLLGRFFELQNFPDTLFYSWIPQPDTSLEDIGMAINILNI